METLKEILVVTGLFAWAAVFVFFVCGFVYLFRKSK